MRKYVIRTCILTILLFVFTTFLFGLKNPIPNKNLLILYTTKNLVIPQTERNRKHVTKSLSELGRTPELSTYTLFFNTIPKSGSELLVLLLQRLEGVNNFRHVRLTDYGKRALTRLEQEQFVDEVTSVIKDKAVPLSFDRTVYFVNFTEFDRQSPTFINLIRDPIETLISKIYYKSVTPKNYDLTFKKKININKYLEDCVRLKQIECSFKDGLSYDLTIPYFCGHDKRCTLFNHQWALTKAKANVERYYPVVGVLEELNTTLEVFTRTIPYFFSGIQRIYSKDLIKSEHNQNKNKFQIKDDIKSYFRNRFICEYDFYEWIKKRLFQQLQIIYGHAH